MAFATPPVPASVQSAILGVGYGYKEVKGNLTSFRSWRFYVRKKRPLSLVPTNERIPVHINGFPTDVIEKSETLLSAHHPPMIANAAGVPGSIGCMAWSQLLKKNVLLTNYHVLFSKGKAANQNVWLVQSIDGNQKFINIGKTFYGKYDIVHCADSPYFIDAAITSINTKESRRIFENLLYVKSFQGEAKASVGDVVYKWGAASGYTKGKIVDIQYPDVVNIREQYCNAPNQILTQPLATGNSATPLSFSTSGDSGSVIVNEDHKIVGLLWGYNQRGEGVACPIQPVLQELSIQIKNPVPLWKRILKTIVPGN